MSRLPVSILIFCLCLMSCNRDGNKPIEAPLPAEAPLKNKLQPGNDKTPKNNTRDESFDPKLRIKLKYDVKGNYSWEITGMNLKQIIETDKILRKKVGTEKAD